MDWIISGFVGGNKDTKSKSAHVGMGASNSYVFFSDVLPRAIKKYGGIDVESLRKAALDTKYPRTECPRRTECSRSLLCVRNSRYNKVMKNRQIQIPLCDHKCISKCSPQRGGGNFGHTACPQSLDPFYE